MILIHFRADALAGPYEDISINKEAEHLDFEVSSQQADG